MGTNIGIYISPADKDIAAWFNLLERNHMPRSKWVHGLLAAYSIDKPLRIGVINKKLPLWKDASGSGNTVAQTGRYKYGWQVRGPNKEYVIGSVVNISIRNDEIKTVLDESWRNGHKLAPFIKSLIRKNLSIGDKEIPPRLNELNQIWSEFLVQANSQKTTKKKEQELPEQVSSVYKPAPAEREADWIKKPDGPWKLDDESARKPTIPIEGEALPAKKNTPPKPAVSEKAFAFMDEPDDEPDFSQAGPTMPSLGKNPSAQSNLSGEK